MTEIFLMDIISEIGKENQGLIHKISHERRRKIQRLRFKEDRNRSLYAELFIRYIACLRLKIDNKDIKFRYNQFDKPYLYGVTNQFFNISHAGHWIICGWSEQEIGVDIEKIDYFDLDIAKNFFSKEEYLDILNQKNIDDQKNLFYDIWTLKESYIKYLGTGLNTPLDSFSFSLENNSINFNPKEKKIPNFYKFDIAENYKMAISTDDFGEIKINYVLPFQLLHECE